MSNTPRGSYTRYVSALRPGVEPPRDGIDAVVRELRRDIHVQLRKRNLLAATPKYIGFVGHGSWTNDILEELLQEAYTRIFCERLDRLHMYVSQGAEIDALVKRSIGQLLYERQTRHDRVGRRAYDLALQTVTKAIEEQYVFVYGDQRKELDKDTVLTFSSHSPGVALAVRDIEEWLEPMPIDYTRTAVQGRSRRAREATLGALRGWLERIEQARVEAFLFGGLLQPLQDKMRTEWQAIALHNEGTLAFGEGDGASPRSVRVSSPSEAFEAAADCKRLHACIEAKIETEERSHGSAIYQVFTALVSWNPEDGRLSNRKLAAQTGVSRKRIPAIRSDLARICRECQSDLGSP